MNKMKDRKTVSTLVAILATFVVGGLALNGDYATASGQGETNAKQSNLLQQVQSGDEPLAGVSNAFTYQGRLMDGPNPANGQYDFEFTLFDAPFGGNQVGILARPNQTVSEGLVTISLNFGSFAFQGQQRHLQVAVRPAGVGTFTTLSPRHAVSPAPYAMSMRPGTTITNTGIVARLAHTSAGFFGSSTGSNTAGVRGESTGLNTAGVRGESTNGWGVYGSSTGSTRAGVRGESTQGRGVLGVTDSGEAGVHGESATGVGVLGFTDTGAAGVNGQGPRGVLGQGIGLAGIGVVGRGNRAGLFEGDVEMEADLDVTGNISKGGGSFKIDHPLDPENKYLYHSFVESPDMMNIYNGNVIMDAKGEATVVLPEWFGALNKEFRYQITAVGAPGPNLYISKKVEDNRFSIAGGTPGMEVSWQVTGIRKDIYAEKNRIPVEEDKGDDRGKYLHPEEHGQPENKGVGYEERQETKEQP